MRKVYEFVDDAGHGVIEDWPRLQVAQRARLEAKVGKLRRAEVDRLGRVDLPPNLLAGPGIYGQSQIYKLKIHGNVALRPMLCLGPIDREAEWTILARAVERDNRLIPTNAADEAEERRNLILRDPNRRRLLWEDDDDSDN